ncbi:MAG TPA: VOC family protein [Gaiellaceae bacterium]|nr:VOC family protein [Gaiellaceae bacterium]
MNGVESLSGGQVFQIAFVVRDLDAALDRYTRVLGGAPWRVFTFSAAIHREATYRGSPTDFSARLALNGTSPQYELIEPVSGAGVHGAWLEEHGEGFHHVGVIVDSVEATTERMAASGYGAIQTGSGFGAAGDGIYAYFDTAADLGFLVEAVEPPERMPDPDRIWP